MAEKDPKSVLSSLPSQRPQRRSQHRKPKQRSTPKENTPPKKTTPRPANNKRSTPKRDSVPEAGYAVPEDHQTKDPGRIAKDAVISVKELLETGLAASSKAVHDTLKRLGK